MAEPDRRGSAPSPSPARLAPEDVATRAFSSAFRGLSESEVRSFLKRVADELSRANERADELERELEARRSAPDDVAPLDEGALLEALGEETTKLLRNAREAAKDIRTRADETAARLRSEAHEESERVRSEANDLLETRTREADTLAAETLARAEAAAEERRREVEEQLNAELGDAKTRGRAMVDEARAVRERMLADLGHRRGLLQGQIAELRAGRDHLLDAYRVVKRTFLDATDALAAVEARFAQSRPLPLDEAEIEAALHPDAGETASAELARALEPDGEHEHEAAVETPAVGDLFARIRAEAGQPEATEIDAVDAAGNTDERGDAVDADIASSAAPAADAHDTHEVQAPTAPPELSSASEDQGDVAGDVDTPPDDVPAAADDEVAPDALEPEVVRAGPLERASAALAPVLASGARRAKRALQDEQNSVLDALRRHKGKPRADAVLPTEEDQVATWRMVIGDALARAYIAGRRDHDPDQSTTVEVPDDLAEAIAAVLLSTLRQRLVDAVEHHDTDGAGERVSARYREWKSQDLDARLEDAVRTAYARGVYDAAADDAELQWVVAQPQCCADCADNSLEPVTRGKAFPTGQQFPPAHPGCRCVLTSD